MNLEEKYIRKQRDLSSLSATPPFPRIIKIDICNTCNYACIFCPQSKQTNKKGFIDDKLCRKIISNAYEAGAREICLSSTGEPLLNPRLEEYISLAKKIGYTYIFFNTNGYLLNRERSEKILSAGVDSVKISLNAGTRETYRLVHGMDGFETVLKNLEDFARTRKELGSACKIYVSYVAVRQTAKEYEELKNRISGYVDETMVMNANRRGGAISEIDENLYNGDDQYTYQYPCSQLFNNVYVSAEGFVNICCQDFENVAVVADLNETDVESAWNCPDFTAFRERYLKGDLKDTLCYNCIHNTNEKVVPLDADRAYFEESDAKIKNLEDRINELIGERENG